MHCVHCGQNIEERTVRVGGEVQPLGTQLSPGKVLATHEQEAERQGTAQPELRRGTISKFVARVVANASPRDFEGDAAREKKGGVPKNDGRKNQRMPVI